MTSQNNDKDWYRTPIDRTLMKQLVQRSDYQGLIRIVGLVAALIVTGYLASLSLGSWWSIPGFLLYGGVWVFATSVVHEASHGTPFRTRWLNEAVLFAAGLMVQQVPTGLRWTHAKHHSETALVGRDVEIVLTNPISKAQLFWIQLADSKSIWYYFSRVGMFAFAKLDAEHRGCVPENQVPRLIMEARIFLGVYSGIVLWSVIVQSWWPMIMFLLPRVTGAPVHGIMLATQHVGFAQNHYDHRLTTRSMKLNPLLGFFYWNMQFHVEHHMFPNIPFHALPALNKQIRHDLPRPTAGVLAALGEIFEVVRRQKIEPNFAYPDAGWVK